MAAIERKSVQFSLPLTLSSYNSYALGPAQAGQSLRANNHHYTQNMSKHNRPNQLPKGYGQFKSLAANTFARSTCQDRADWSLAARAEGGKRTLANDDEGSDDDIPSLNELFRTTQPPDISSQALKRECSLQSL
ncbi:hypothetical protein B0J14DRAFT_663175 [Halenospora varia]|nr:hypothetical protein B0J14DRAFT_663175 [Halenospora varia]